MCEDKTTWKTYMYRMLKFSFRVVTQIVLVSSKVNAITKFFSECLILMKMVNNKTWNLKITSHEFQMAENEFKMFSVLTQLQLETYSFNMIIILTQSLYFAIRSIRYWTVKVSKNAFYIFYRIYIYT